MAAVPIVDHVSITASEFAAGLAFYDAALGALGLVRLVELVDEEEDDPPVEVAAWGAEGAEPVLWLVSGAATGARTTGLHVCLRAGRREDVEAFHAAAVHAGGTSHAAPRPWTSYRRGEFTATVRDGDGNLLEVVALD